MSNERQEQETVSDIMSEMREYADSIEKHLIYDLGECPTDYLRVLADRIEAAHKREREAGAEADQICGEIGEMVGRGATCKESVTNCNQLGNAAAMREALSDSCYAMFNFLKTQNGGYVEMANALDKSKAALAKPPRNCDVGTPEEQSARFDAHCRKHIGCLTCSLREKDGGVPKHCELAWAQMPYEEGGAE